MLARLGDEGAGFSRRDAWRLAGSAILLLAAIAVVLGLDFLPGSQLRPGEPAPQTVLAPRAARFVSEVLSERAREEARSAVEPQYDYTAAGGALLATQQVAQLNRTAAPVDAAFAADLPPGDRAALLATALPDLSPELRAVLVGRTAERWAAVREEAARVLDVLVRAELRDTQVAVVRAGVADRMAGGLDAPERALAAALVAPFVVPNSSYSAQLTDQARDRAAELVEPVLRFVEQGETIVRTGDLVDDLAWEAVDHFGLDRGGVDLVRVLGFVVLSGMLIGILLGWIWRFRPDYWHRNNVLLLLGLLLLLAVVVLKVTTGRTWVPYALPLAAVGILVAVLLDAGIAVVLTTLVAVLAGTMSGGGIWLAVYVVLGGFAGIVTVRRGDRVRRFVEAGLAVLGVNVAFVLALALLGNRDLRGVLELLAASLVSAGGAAVVAVGSFAALGSLFGILTVFQLLELASPTQPLLRRLLVEAPGTYHHSLMVGNLAERAAEAIGGEPLLARVAAYYHDVGKLANPAAFIENQAGGENLHDELDPEASAQLLKSHVSEGIDLAYRSGLPKALIAFIPQHHGTAVMSYFLDRARRAAAAPHGGLGTAEGARAADAVDVRRFRHGGPKPQSREAAIVMLADSVEASVRSLSSRDETAIRAMVVRIMEERIADDQFDECDLTLRDVERIREAFVEQLLGIYHRRVEYPQNRVIELEARRAAGDER